ncbi:hypothetical protein D3C77_719860 [compost metagenome]
MLNQAGHDLAQASVISVGVRGAHSNGSGRSMMSVRFFGGWLSDKFSIKHVLVVFYVVGAVALTLLGAALESACCYR